MQYISNEPVYQEDHYQGTPTTRLARSLRTLPPFAAGALVLIVGVIAIMICLAFVGHATHVQAVAAALVAGALIALAYKVA